MRSFPRTAALAASAAAVFGARSVGSAQAEHWSLSSTLVEHASRVPSIGAMDPLDGTPPILIASYRHSYKDGRYAGPAADAYYGLVQVEVKIQGGRLVSIQMLQYPSDRSTSRAINARALPALEREVIRAQSARVHAVSGASLTSDAYLRSLDAALRRASG